MASGISSKVKTSNTWTYVWLEWNSVSNGATANSSTVTVKVYASRVKNDGYTTYGKGSGSVTISGPSGSHTGTFSISNNQVISSTNPVLMGTVTLTVPHDGSGNWSGTISGGYTIDYVTTGTSSTNAVFDSIPRKSSISNASGTIGSPINLTISAYNTSFRHDVRIYFGNVSVIALSKVAAGTHSWTPPIAWCEQIPNNVSGRGTIYVDTYSGNTLLGTSAAATLTLSVPSDAIPDAGQISIEKADTIIPVDWGIYVKNKSQIKITASGYAGTYGASISNVSINCCGVSKTGAENTFDITLAGVVPITVTITDSRGRTNTAVDAITVEDYSPPRITEVLTKRCTETGVDHTDGTYAKCNAKFTYSSCQGHNSLTKWVEYKEKSASVFINRVPYTDDIVIGNGTLNTEQYYDIRYIAIDFFGEQTYTDFISTAFVTLEVLNGGRGVSLGKVAELPNTFDVAFESKFRENTVFDKNVNIDGELYTTGGKIIFPNTRVETTSTGSFAITNTLGKSQLLLSDSDGNITFWNTTGTANGGLKMRVYNSTGSIELPTGGFYCFSAGFDWDPSRNLARIYNKLNGGWLGVGNSGIPWCSVGRLIYSPGDSVHYLKLGSNAGDTYLEVTTVYGAFGVSMWASDTRLKKNITSFKKNNRGIATIMQIEVVSFDWKDTGEHVELGLSANQLEEISEDLIIKVGQQEDSPIYDKNEPFIRQVNESTLVTELVLAVQQQQDQIKALQQQIKVLQKQIKDIFNVT